MAFSDWHCNGVREISQERIYDYGGRQAFDCYFVLTVSSAGGELP